MSRPLVRFFPLSLAAAMAAYAQQQLPPAQRPSESLLSVRRIYVAPLTGNASAEALRELIIASIDNTRLFTLTDDPSHADAFLKGAADDKTFTDTLDTDKSLDDRMNLGLYGGGSRSSSKSIGGYGGSGVNDHEAHHLRERKHEAYAAVRLTSRDGDVLWSTTQESMGSKFRGASSDVANKIARQLTADVNAASRTPQLR